MRPRATAFALTVILVLPAVALGGSAHASARSPVRAAPLAGVSDDISGSKRLPPLLAPSVEDGLSGALAAGRITAGRYALERVISLFDLAQVRARFGSVVRSEPRSATLLMRDLVLRLDQLTGARLATARRILARPTDGIADPEGDGYTVAEETPFCATHTCVHYVGSTADAPPLADSSGAAGVPDWVETVSGVLESVWTQEVGGLGYRPPKSDATSMNDGGSALLDVYLVDVGGAGLFGYCTTDDPNAAPGSTYQFFDVSAYCVLDDDFAFAQFGYPDPMDPLGVTAAHEFFHAVQFAYDIAEDGWLLESTATWMEDELFDDVNDNLLYLPFSPLAKPHIPLDRSVAPGWYGAWIFWRFLAEYFGGATPDPTIVRAVWRLADGSFRPSARDMYSTQALASAVAARSVGGKKWRLRWAFADFAAWNARPVRFYDEGASYPAATLAKTVTLSSAVRSTSSTAGLDHLTNRFVAVRRGAGLGATARLRVTVNGPAYLTGPEASVVVIKKSGATGFKGVSLNASGDGVVQVNFGSTVARVVVIMTNASARYVDCWADATPFACFGGRPLDQNRSYTFRAAVV